MPKSPTRHGAQWTGQDFATIRKLLRAGTPARKIAKILGRTLASLYMKASIEGISLAAPKHRVSKRLSPRTRIPRRALIKGLRNARWQSRSPMLCPGSALVLRGRDRAD